MHLITDINCTLCTLLNIIIILASTTIGLRDVRVQIPHAVKRGERAILKCLYDLEGDSLYSVKWYKGRREFYSFTPKEFPAMKVFQFAGVGVKVDRLHSNESQLVLESVNAATTGKYSCEVSADAPSFHTLIGAGELEVVVVPGKDPVISGIHSRYRVGDILRGNCTAGHSRPAANITWNINGYEINPAHVKHYKPVKDTREMETVTSGIHFVVTPQHFIYGKLKIRCTAHIHDVYWKSTEKSVEENRHSKLIGQTNVKQAFSEDYFDMEEDNVVDRSDTYTANIKGDVSSLNASGGSATLHACLFTCFWPGFATLSLFVYYGMQQMLQLFFGQKTINGHCLAFNEKRTPKNNKNSYEDIVGQQRNGTIVQRKVKKPMAKAQQQPPLEQQLQLATTVRQHRELHVEQQQQQRHCLSGTILSEVATICYKEQTNKKELLSEKYFQIKLINNKKEQLLQRQRKQQHEFAQEMVQENHQKQLQHKKPHHQQQKRQQHRDYFRYCQQHYYPQQHQVACDKTVYEDYNLTMTTQVANIFNVATCRTASATTTMLASTPSKIAVTANPIVVAQICHKPSTVANHNLYAQQQSCCSLTIVTTANNMSMNICSNLLPFMGSTKICRSKDVLCYNSLTAITSRIPATQVATSEAAAAAAPTTIIATA